MPLCNFQSSFDVLPLAPNSPISAEAGVQLHARMDSGTTCASMCLFAALLTLLFVRPTNVINSSLRPSFFHDQVPHHIAVLVCPRLGGLPSQHRLDWFQPTHAFKSLTLVCWLPISSSGPSRLVSKTSSSRPADRPISCRPPPVPQKNSVCHYGH